MDPLPVFARGHREKIRSIFYICWRILQGSAKIRVCFRFPYDALGRSDCIFRVDEPELLRKTEASKVELNPLVTNRL